MFDSTHLKAHSAQTEWRMLALHKVPVLYGSGTHFNSPV